MCLAKKGVVIHQRPRARGVSVRISWLNELKDQAARAI